MKAVLAAFALILATFPVHAEQSQRFGDYEVHYNAISTDTLVPEVARNYKINRSKNRGLLTVSVLRRDAGTGTPVAAKVSANAANLSEQLRGITMREVKEGTAIYYIGEFGMAPPETLRFDLSVKIEGSKEPVKVEFRQQFF